MKNIYNKIIVYLCTCRFIIFLYFIVISLICLSCGSSPKISRNSNDNQEKASIVKTNDIPIAVSITHTGDEDMRQMVDVEYEVTRETDYEIYIDINSSYYKRYTSGIRFKTDKLPFFENSENVENLTLCLDVVNNTSKKLSINELDINVEESKLDTTPIVYICTTEERSNSIYFVNESWFNWKGITFSYSLLKKGETFNGHYKKTRHIPYFDSYTIIDLLPDMISMGYDYDGLVESIKTRYPNSINNDDSSNFIEFCITEEDENFRFFQNKFEPFGLKKDSNGEYVGSATLYGSIIFDNVDFKVDFIAEVSLSSSGGFGALSYERYDGSSGG